MPTAGQLIFERCFQKRNAQAYANEKRREFFAYWFEDYPEEARLLTTGIEVRAWSG